MPSGFFLKKNPPRTILARARLLWFRSMQRRRGQQSLGQEGPRLFVLYEADDPIRSHNRRTEDSRIHRLSEPDAFTLPASSNLERLDAPLAGSRVNMHPEDGNLVPSILCGYR